MLSLPNVSRYTWGAAGPDGHKKLFFSLPALVQETTRGSKNHFYLSVSLGIGLYKDGELRNVPQAKKIWGKCWRPFLEVLRVERLIRNSIHAQAG